MRYQWKGEIRELENVIERAVIFCDGDFITLEHLPEYMMPLSPSNEPITPYGQQTLKDAVKNFERQFIQQALIKYNQNKEEVARGLGVSLSSLYRKIEELAIEVSQS
jgi:DNA-binding NtrC family response regulator